MSDFMDRARELGNLVWRKAKQGGEAAAEALEQQAAIQRLAAQARKLDRERKTTYAEIGMKVYALHSQGKVRNQDVLGDCRRLDDIAVEVARLKQQIEDIRTASLARGIKLPELGDVSALTEDVSDDAVEDAADAAVVAEVAAPPAVEPAAADETNADKAPDNETPM